MLKLHAKHLFCYTWSDRILTGTFFALQRCADMQHSEVRIVKGVDERLTGEAYVHICGPRAKLRLALSKDRTLMPVRDSTLQPLACNLLTLPSNVCPERHSNPCRASLVPRLR